MPCLKVLFSLGRHSQQVWLHRCVQGMGNSVSAVKLMPFPSCRVSKARADVVYSPDLSGSQANWESISSSLIPLSSVGKSWLKCAHNKPGLQDARNMTCHLSCPQFSTSLLLVMLSQSLWDLTFSSCCCKYPPRVRPVLNSWLHSRGALSSNNPKVMECTSKAELTNFKHFHSQNSSNREREREIEEGRR